MKIKILVLITLLVGLMVLVYIACNKSTPTQPQATPVPAQTQVAKQAEPTQPQPATPATPPIKPPLVSIAKDESRSGTIGLLSLTGAIFTTDATCTGVDLNIYASKEDVYIDGGPAHPGAAGLPDGKYYVQVTEPGGKLLGTSVGSGNETPVEVTDGEFDDCYQLWAILIKASNGTQGYDDTGNPGGEYKVWVSQVSTFDQDKSKTDNFKVKEGGCTPCTITCPGNVTVECDESTHPSNTGYPTTTCTATPTYSDKVTPGTACPQAYTITRTWSVDDGCEGTATCTQTITVVDTKAPVLSGCPDPDGGSYECLSEVPDPPTVTATDICDTDVPVVYEQTQSNPGSNCHNTITRTWTATDDCGNSASCSQTIYVDDTTPPTVQCPSNVTVYLNVGDPCPPVVTFTATGEDNCGGAVTVSCNPPSGSTFPVGTTTVTCTATDECGNVSDPCQFTVTVYSAVCALKFYDANANGINDDGQVVAGWKFNLSGNGSKYTGSDGKTCFTGLLPGSYTVTEVAPNTKWIATTPTSKTVNLGCPTTVEFGNVCLGAGGGLTLGFWSNKNGERQMNDGGSAAPELAMLSALCLRNANGSDFDPTTYSAFRTWILGATATNMAYMLSAQLAAMELNIEAGFVSGSSLVYAPGCGGFITINALVAAAEAALCVDGYTPSGDPNRAYQECLKNALDNANNNKNFVQPYPCPFTSPY